MNKVCPKCKSDKGLCTKVECIDEDFGDPNSPEMVALRLHMRTKSSKTKGRLEDS